MPQSPDIQKLLNGDTPTWNQFVDQYAGVLLSAIRRVARLPEHKEQDLLQELFMKLVADDFKLLRSFDPQRAKLSTWLTIVARHMTIDLLRKKSWDLEALPAQASEQMAQSNDHQSSVDLQLDETATAKRAQVSDKGQAQMLRIANTNIPVGLLTSRQILILRMSYEKKMETAEIASFLKVEAQTIRSAKHKAIDKLRKHLPKPL